MYVFPPHPYEELIPPNDQALALPIEGLALRLLAVVKRQHSLCNSDNVGNADSWRGHIAQPRADEFLQAISEAFNWLENNGLVAPDPGGGGNWMIVTRKGEEIAASPDGLAALRASERLALELHPRLGSKVRQLFEASDFEMAVIASMRAVEIRVRDLAGLDASVVGVDLINQAFGAKGKLTDRGVPKGEQEAARSLYAGALGLFRNPAAHREVKYENATVASEIIFLADLLLRMLDQVADRLGVA